MSSKQHGDKRYHSIFNKARWILFAGLAAIIGLYPVLYFVVPGKFKLLNGKSAALLASIAWNTAFYTHIVLGGLALLIGWSQFHRQLRQQHTGLHRTIGKTYVLAALLSSLAGIYLGFYAMGGPIAAVGFICLGLVWFTTTFTAWLYIRRGLTDQHEKMMIYSYAACFGAVTLRLWLPVLTMLYHDFMKAYVCVAWLSWVPNIMVAYFMVQQKAVRNRSTTV
ncbi:DUF2306 domain-containing protein [Chitinophaga nivalis]|uniref:DUF2306 domain-containing protein n=1 Tax=Chitinophaga nivalis TaxID=2991709 RepID=A0ABT3IWH1_9BACT|nr:DUF2306 domain-containing protein [Chitinophaga nivalis]MCW3462014.1 DUF2306 domain-containing protein [Chitinophaga nivalis]MCW3488294.1 DUF2306 domain-containing protein [Chitinophaga nivalis]